MLQLAAVITTGGLLLFSSTFPLNIQIFNSIANFINDSKNLQALFTFESLKVNYLYDALLGLIYVIAWRREISLEYPEKLLRSMSLEWKNAYEQIIWKQQLLIDAPNFQPYWDRAFQNWKNYVNEKEENSKNKMATYESKKGGKSKKPKQKQKDEQAQTTVEPQMEYKISGNSDSPNEEQKPTSPKKVDDEADLDSLSPRERFIRKQQVNKKNKVAKKSPAKDEEQKTVRTWEGGKVTKKVLQNLDRSKKDSSPRTSQVKSNIYLDEKSEKVDGFLGSDDEDDKEDEKSNTFLNKWVGKLKNIVGDKKITREDLNQVLQDFKQKLMEKNVAQQVAIQVSEAVGATLLDSKTKSFTSVHKTVKQAMKEALRKILTPKRKIDIIVEVAKQRQNLKPYVIVFVGVNGVGKSTNLAKVAFKLKNAKLTVMLAACDNFRAGAVEQIETHGRNLDIPVFQKGYKEEPAMIAYEAIKQATRQRIDAVLVDTAGRMQNNQPLMKELARLVKMNKPNLVVFIGQALAGNDAVDQITKFNQALQEESTETFKPQIDAILLSKFDTVDDKVGAALSLVYSTSKPILYVGVGQKYPDLKELNVSTVVRSLLA